MAEKEYIERGAVLVALEKLKKEHEYADGDDRYPFVYGALTGVRQSEAYVESIPAADVVEVDKVAEMLRTMFDDDCACNYNGNDEWLTTKCKYAETDCPTPEDNLGCWKEFVKHFLAKMDGGKHETD